jgi:hypothetical protein
MDEHPRSAANFYGVIVAAMVIGMALNFANLDAIKLLVWAAVVNGLRAAAHRHHSRRVQQPTKSWAITETAGRSTSSVESRRS